MRFEARDLKPYAEPVTVDELQPGSVYFSVQFLDQEMLIPCVEPLIFLGRDLCASEAGLYFQDAESYRGGIRFDGPNASEGTFYIQPQNQINHVFSYERALDVLMSCSLRRRAP